MTRKQIRNAKGRIDKTPQKADQEEVEKESHDSNDAPEEMPIRSSEGGQRRAAQASRKISKKELKRQKEILKLLNDDKKKSDEIKALEPVVEPEVRFVHRTANIFNVDETKPGAVVLRGKPNPLAARNLREFKAKSRMTLDRLRRPLAL